ncbi:polysaccharide biosynthesis/export family protein [soil metagenome]
MNQFRLFLFVLAFFVLSAHSVSILGQSPVPSTTPATQFSEDELVHFGDVIDVDFLGGFEFDWRGTITPEGFLDGLDGYGEPIYGLCRTEAQVVADIVRIYSKTLRDPKVVVRIIDRSNRAVVRLEGAVRTPTRFRLKRAVSLRELLVLAGGITDGASGDITIFRPNNVSCRKFEQPVASSEAKSGPDNGSVTTNIKITDLLKGESAGSPTILSGDMITVGRAMPVYVIGAVNNPRPIYVRSELAVSRAIAIAGGLAKDAEGRKVTISRRDGSDSHLIALDLEKIKRGESEDELLKPFDIIDVASKGGGSRKYPPVAASNDGRDRVKVQLPLRVVD